MFSPLFPKVFKSFSMYCLTWLKLSWFDLVVDRRRWCRPWAIAWTGLSSSSGGSTGTLQVTSVCFSCGGTQHLGAGKSWSFAYRTIFFFFFLIFVSQMSLFIYLFIYWLCWVFVSVRGLSLVGASGGHSSSRCAGL